MSDKPIVILGIESSCDDTAAAVIRDHHILSNIVAGQAVHKAYGGVVPELASRAHQKNILPVVDLALKRANITKNELSAIAYTQGPGLLGSLLVGSGFAKAMALALNIPALEIHHMHAHILAHFIANEKGSPAFPFLCLTVSGGHTQIVKVSDPFTMEVLGETLDDAAGEAFDKVAKILGLDYPGGPLVDKLASSGNPMAFKFPMPYAPGHNFSFSGLKTSFLYFIKEQVKKDPLFIESHKADICASIQKTIIDILLNQVVRAAEEYGIKEIAIAGGVSANTGLRARLMELEKEKNWKVHIPPFEYCTDNGAMIAMAGVFKFKRGDQGFAASAASARLAF